MNLVGQRYELTDNGNLWVVITGRRSLKVERNGEVIHRSIDGSRWIDVTGGPLPPKAVEDKCAEFIRSLKHPLIAPVARMAVMEIRWKENIHGDAWVVDADADMGHGEGSGAYVCRNGKWLKRYNPKFGWTDEAAGSLWPDQVQETWRAAVLMVKRACEQ
jgi:hypothetical protein